MIDPGIPKYSAMLLADSLRGAAVVKELVNSKEMIEKMPFQKETG